MPIYPRLAAARSSAGLTQQQLAERLGVDQAVIAKWEAGSRQPRVLVAVRLSEVLGTTANAIWPSDCDRQPDHDRRSKVKDHVVTYIRPGKPDLPLGSCVLHEPSCRYLKPTPSRPYTGSRKATPAELASQPRCRVC
jgi:transcriptional regulator with XRE-family HTH domain